MEDALFYRRWIVANGWAEAAGLGTTFVLGRALAPRLEQAAGTAAVLLGTLACALGLATGPILGLAQWSVLRRHVKRAGCWLWANAAAWAVGMPMIFLGMDHVPWTGPPAAVVLAIYGVSGAVGLMAGAIHGRALVVLVGSGPRPLGA